MTVFKDAAEIYDYVGGIFETALESPFGTDLANTGMALRLNFTGPEASLIVDLKGRQVRRVVEGDDSSDAGATDAVVTMSGDDANKFWQGKLSMMSALAGRKIKVQGNVRALIRLQPSSAFLYEVYRERLRREDRNDLLLS